MTPGAAFPANSHQSVPGIRREQFVLDGPEDPPVKISTVHMFNAALDKASC